MQLLISDANILIDLEEGQLIEVMFKLPFNFSIPDILFEEEMAEEHGYLPDLGLNLEEYTNPSRHDCFALALAKDKECPLLTGDKALRKAAEIEAVMVNGTLWVVEQMIHQQLITIDQAKEATLYDTLQRCIARTNRCIPWLNWRSLL